MLKRLLRKRTIRIMEAIYDLMPPEEWERLHLRDERPYLGTMKEIMMIYAEGGTCYRSTKTTLRMMKKILEEAKLQKPVDARCHIMNFIGRKILNKFW